MSTRAGQAKIIACETLEPRQLMSSFAYSDLAGLVRSPDAASLGDGFVGPVVALGDLDGDGTTDLLAGNAYRHLQFYTGEVVLSSGAAVISGRTGGQIRTHTPADTVRFGWSVAALSDVDADGIPDYGIGTGGPEGAPFAYVYSGATGDLLYSFGAGASGGGIAGNVIAAAGDVNGDGRADILVSSIENNRTDVYSGLDGSVIRAFESEGAYGLAGGKDLDGDGVPDLVSGTQRYLSAYSGATGARLWRIDQPQAYALPSVSIDNSTDFDGDGRVDLLVTTNDYFIVDGAGKVRLRARLYSGRDGSQLLFIPGPADRGLAGAAGVVQDLDGDGIPEIAASVRGTQSSQYGAGDGNGVYVYSGSNGALVTVLTDDGPATLTPPEAAYHGTPVRMAILGGVTAVDLNGDGFSEVITSAVRDSQGSAQEAVTLRIITFDGATLGGPVFDGVTTDEAGNLIAWGHLGASGFFHYQGRTTLITSLGFQTGDRVLEFSPWTEGVLMVVQTAADPANPVAWYGMADLTPRNIYFIPAAGRTGEPPGVYTFGRVVDVDGGRVLVQMMRDSTTPTTWVFQLAVGGIALPTAQLVYRFDGRPVALRDERIVAIPNDDPADTLLWDFTAEPVRIDGLTPVGLFLGPADGGNPPPVTVVGLAQRDGDPVARPYYYDADGATFRGPPLPEGSAWAPASVSSAGDVAGTFERAGGGGSVFLTRYLYGADPSIQTVDVLGSTLIGAPGPIDGPTAAVIGLAVSRSGRGPFEVYIRHLDPDTGRRAAALADIEGSGPYRAPSGAAFALSRGGDRASLVTRNLAGEVLLYTSWFPEGQGEQWVRRDLAYSPGGPAGPPLYDAEHFGPIVTWFEPDFFNPFIALATEDGLMLIEPVLTGPPGVTTTVERYQVRNLTTELASSEAIVSSLITMRPMTGLQLLSGLSADGDLVLYGLTSHPYHQFPGQSTWAYANLYDQVLRPAGLEEPRFDVARDGDLVAYVTRWNGLNIAGIDADSGDVMVFWTAPGLPGWQVANLDQSLADPSAVTGVSHLNVYLTSWGGINLVGGAKLGVYWWAPGMGATWAFDELAGIAAGAHLVPETVTAYVTPWDGLNVAGLDQTGRLWVYWWTPTVYWTAETIDAALSDRDASVERVGRLRSEVTLEGRIWIFARSPFGDPLRYAWAPGAEWALTDLNSTADRYL